MRVDIIDTSKTIRGHQVYTSSSKLFPAGYGVVFLFPTSSLKSYTEPKGSLQDGNKDADLERPCRHMHLAGRAIALPTTIARNVTIPFRYADDLQTSDLDVTELRTTAGFRTFNGPVFMWDSFESFVKEFPDDKSLLYHHRNTFLKVTRTGVNTCEFHSSTEYKRPWGSDKDWFIQSSIFTVEYNPAGTAYRINDGSWTSGSMFQLYKTQTALMITDFVFPKTTAEHYRLYERLSKQFRFLPSDNFYGDLVRRCANDAVVVPANSIELIMELRALRQTIQAAYDLSKGKVDAKKIASAYLQYKYGLRLTAMDLTAMVKGVARRVMRTRSDKSRSRARETYSPQPKSYLTNVVGSCDVQYNYKINYYVRSEDWRDGLRNLFDSGLFPSLTNAWDLLPLSFVLDWFFKIESYLDAIDANTYWSLYRISSVVYSNKITFRDINSLFSTENWTLAGDARFVYYDRNVQQHVHTPLFFDPTPRDFHNYAELTSLIVVNRR